MFFHPPSPSSPPPPPQYLAPSYILWLKGHGVSCLSMALVHLGWSQGSETYQPNTTGVSSSTVGLATSVVEVWPKGPSMVQLKREREELTRFPHKKSSNERGHKSL